MDGTSEQVDQHSAPKGSAGSFVRDPFMAPYQRDLGDPRALVYGDVLEGIIVGLDSDGLVVDLGFVTAGIVPEGEYSRLSDDEKAMLRVGEAIAVFVVNAERMDGRISVSILRARRERQWWDMEARYEANEIIEAEVTHANTSGLLANLDGIVGFVPASRLSGNQSEERETRLAIMTQLIGMRLPMTIIEFDRYRRHLVLSVSEANRILRKRERRATRMPQSGGTDSGRQPRLVRSPAQDQVIDGLTIGDLVHGRVSAIVDYGVFVDIGGAIGLVHSSELSWSRVHHADDFLSVGDDIAVSVLNLFPESGKIALSIKRTQEEPWSRAAATYEVDRLIRGSVAQVVNFGAFVRIEDGIEGLLHISELADDTTLHPNQIVESGQQLILRIISIDPERHRMGLSLRSALNASDTELLEAFGEGVLEERDALGQTIRVALEAIGPSEDEAP